MIFKVGDTIILTETQGMPKGTTGVIMELDTGDDKTTVRVRYEGQDECSSFPYQDPKFMRHLSPLGKLI